MGSVSHSVVVGSSAIKIKTSYKYKGKYIPSGMRSKITSFSTHAKRNLLWRLQTLDYKLLNILGYKAFFITLTVQKDYYLRSFSMPEFKEARSYFEKQLHRFFKRLGIESFSFWKMEFHASGVPHYHLFLFFKKPRKTFIKQLTLKSFRSLVRDLWLTALSLQHQPPADELSRMRKSSTNVRYVPLDKNVLIQIYISKEVGKTLQTDSNLVDSPGRFWGISNRSVYKKYVNEQQEVIPSRVFFKLRRVFRKYARSKGYNLKIRSFNGMTLFYLQDIDYFIRLLDYFLNVYREEYAGGL